MKHFVYLHGFASSPGSSKARFFAERLAALGQPLHCPDLNLPDFSTLTTTRMISQVEELLRGLPAGEAIVIGSSLGAFVAWHVAARAGARRSELAHVRLQRLVLLAPALDFGGANRMRDLGADGLARWRDAGWHTFQHHAYNEPRALHYAFYDDAGRYRADLAEVRVPTLVFQGTRDEVVDPEIVAAFCTARPNILLRLLDDGHQLLDHVETLWTETAAFVGLPER